VGSGDLREQVAAHLTRHLALPTTPGQVVITAGAQQALSIVFAVAAGRPATVVTPCPTYPGTRSAAAGRRIRFVGVPADGPEGPDPEALGRAARRADNAVVYAMAAGANPTGAVMPPSRRHHLLEAAAAAGALVVEDLALADLVYDAAPAPPLAALAPGVVAVGSVSKLLWAGLRVGWIRADEPLRRRVLCALVDVERALRLEAAGFETHVEEFVAPTVTPHNLLLCARRTGSAARMARAAERLAGLSPQPC